MNVPSLRLFTREFLALNAALFLAFVNVAAFFGYYEYLAATAVPSRWFGLLIGLFSVVSLVLRPLLSPLLRAENARRWIALGAVGVAVTLLGYGPAQTLPAMVAVRAAHGAAHVVLATALLAFLVGFIPPERSGQAFGLVSIVALLPFALVPAVLPAALAYFGGFPATLAVTSAVTLAILPLVWLSPPPPGSAGSAAGPLRADEIWANLRNPGVAGTLLVQLLFYCAFSSVFFFLEGCARGRGFANPGLFFTLSSASEIGVRLFAGQLFDQGNKTLPAVASLAGLALGYGVLAVVRSPLVFYALGAFLGLGWGIAMPLLNALLFDLSPPRFRALNTNLGMVTFQAGQFVGPLAGGFVVNGAGFGALYGLCAALSFVSAGLALRLGVRPPAPEAAATE